MLAPRIEACYFGAGVHDQWPRLARVFAFAAARHCPGWACRVEALAYPSLRAFPHAHPASVENTLKLDRWCALVEAAPDGALLLLVDVDAVILRPLDDVWGQAFDVAYTVRAPRAQYPLNAGVVFVRASAASRRFFRAWQAENRRMLADSEYHRPWRRRYGGMNQAALGCVLESPAAQGVDLLALPCVEWNCEDSSWAAFDPAVTRILHVKSALRRTAFGIAPSALSLKPLAAVWKRLEREALAAAGAPAAQR